MIRKYPIELEKRILKEYRPGINGYKRLAKKYGLTKGLVRDWVMKKKLKDDQKIHLDPEEKEELKRLKKEVKYLRDANMFWKNYVEIIQKDIIDSKKKVSELKQSKKQKKKEPEL